MSRRSNGGDGVDETCSSTAQGGINNPLASSSEDEKKNDHSLISPQDEQQQSTSAMNASLVSSPLVGPGGEGEDETSSNALNDPAAASTSSSSTPLIGGSLLHQQGSSLTFSSPLTVTAEAAAAALSTSSGLSVFATTIPPSPLHATTSGHASNSNNNNIRNKRKQLPQHDDDASYDTLFAEEDEQAGEDSTTAAHHPQPTLSSQQPLSAIGGLDNGLDEESGEDDTFTKAARAFAARAQALSDAAEAAATAHNGLTGTDPSSVEDDAEGADQEVPMNNGPSSNITWKPQEKQSVCEFTHTIKNYSSKRDSGCKKAEYSDITVDDCGNKWRLIVYVNGNGRASNHHLSLFLQVRRNQSKVKKLMFFGNVVWCFLVILSTLLVVLPRQCH
jgi:hypothetical protein